MISRSVNDEVHANLESRIADLEERVGRIGSELAALDKCVAVDSTRLAAIEKAGGVWAQRAWMFAMLGLGALVNELVRKMGVL